MPVRLIGDSKLSLEVSVSVHCCVFCLCLCGPVIAWRPVQAVRLNGLSGHRKWMEAWISLLAYFIEYQAFYLKSKFEIKITDKDAFFLLRDLLCIFQIKAGFRLPQTRSM